MSYVLGVDAGGSKTLCAVASTNGEVLALGRAGTGNWQGPGIASAREAVAGSIEQALERAGIRREQVEAAYFGMAGADRPEDFERVRELLAPLIEWPLWAFENDATIALRAEVATGPGIGVICGSGTNVVAIGDSGAKIQVGGFGFAFGDAAGAGHIGMLAMREAWRGIDGRGPATMLGEAICGHFSLARLSDVIELYYAGDISWGELSPLVFTAAQGGDEVARRILAEVGEELAISASAAWRQLFRDGAADIPVVAGGSVFQKPEFPLLFDTFRSKLESRHPGARVVRLQVPPVLGAIHGALELAGVSLDDELLASYRAKITSLEAKVEVLK